METANLQAKKRPKGTKSELSQLRKAGQIPAVVYGLKKDPESISIDMSEIRPHMAKRNQLFELDLDGQKQQVLIKVIDRDPIRKDILHLDFIRVDNSHPVAINVPVTTHGIPVGVKTEGGVFSVMKKFVKLKAKIQDLPEMFDLDVSNLSSGTIFYVKDLVFDKGTFLTPGKTALFGVTSGRKQDEEAAAAATAATAASAAASAATAASKPAAAAAPAAGAEKKAPAGGKK